MAGFKCFDPENRRYMTCGNVYFEEDFSHRIDALRHHDQRRALLQKDLEQPVQLDDFADPNASAVRNLYLDPDTPQVSDSSVSGAEGRIRGAANDVADVSSSVRVVGHVEDGDTDNAVGGDEVLLRPLRLLPIGARVPLSDEDHEFLKFALSNKLPISFLQPCPKVRDTPSRTAYLKYMHAENLPQAIELGMKMKDLYWDYSRGFIKFPTHESTQPGHVHHAQSVSSDFSLSHALNAFALEDSLFVGLSGRKSMFQESIGSSFPSVDLLPQFQSKVHSDCWAYHCFNAQTGVDIDFSLPPEPSTYRDSLPDVCSEAAEWKGARDEEMESMHQFGVYERVPISAARGRQILGTKWVMKRKVNKYGKVTRYRARLVAQGFRQRAWDSFDPDDIYSPVVHKDSLRVMLSIAAAEGLQVHQADVKAAFLQAPLK